MSFVANAQLLVEKQRFEIENFKTFNGNSIKNVEIGWEAYGKLNEDKSNVILITHYFSGTSHAAGKYSETDTTTGYWDSIIGPGKAIDTNQFYVISSDTLVNANVHDPNVITTGPASIDPKTGKPYGLSFPVVTIRDFVNVQKALLDSLGIEKLHAVIGPSMGSFQALDWASHYPGMVPRMISVIGAGQTDAWTNSMLQMWAMPIRMDANWNQGNYYESIAPTEGLIRSLMLITFNALTPEYINHSIQNHHANQQAPLMDIKASFAAEDWLYQRAKSRSQLMDANHVLYLVRASQLYMAGFNGDLQKGLSKVKAKSLFIAASKDVLLHPYLAKEAHNTLLALGKESRYQEFKPETLSLGHLDGIANIPLVAKQISSFLSD